MQFIFNLLALLWPFYQFSELPINFPVRLYGIDLLTIVCCLLLIFNYQFNHPLKKPLLYFCCALFISLLTVPLHFPSITTNTWFISGLYFFRFTLYAMLIFTTNKIKPILHLSFFFVPLIGLFQYFLLPDLRFLTSIGYDDHYYRLTFPFFDPGFTATALVFIIFISLKYYSSKSYKILITLSLFALALTFSRSGYLSFVFGLIYFIICSHGYKKHAKTLFFALVFLILIIIASPKPFGEGVNLNRTYSILSRLENNRYGINLFLSHPISGVGFNTLRYINDSNFLSRSSAGIANSFIFITATSGIIGIFTFLIFIINTLVFTKTNPFYQTAIITLLINCLTNNSFFFAPLTILFFLSLASFRDNT